MTLSARVSRLVGSFLRVALVPVILIGIPVWPILGLLCIGECSVGGAGWERQGRLMLATHLAVPIIGIVCVLAVLLRWPRVFHSPSPFSAAQFPSFSSLPFCSSTRSPGSPI